MSEKLAINTQILDGTAMVTLSGEIDEDSNFSKLESLSDAKYVFDFNDITMINSCGIREWITFIEKLDPKISIVYQRCPQVIIEQINMVHGFLRAGAQIESFYAPYFSEDEDKEYKILLKVDQIKDGKAPDMKSPDTGDDLEFDAIEEQYFNFLKQSQAANGML